MQFLIINVNSCVLNGIKSECIHSRIYSLSYTVTKYLIYNDEK